jgi:hypothetical protein
LSAGRRNVSGSQVRAPAIIAIAAVIIAAAVDFFIAGRRAAAF